MGAVSDLRRKLEAITAKWKDERSASKELKRLVQKSEKSRSKLRGEYRNAQATWKVRGPPSLAALANGWRLKTRMQVVPVSSYFVCVPSICFVIFIIIYTTVSSGNQAGTADKADGHGSSIVLQGEKTELLKEKQSLERDLATSWQEYDQAAQVRVVVETQDDSS